MDAHVTDDARKLRALIRLGLARQSKLDKDGQVLYLDELVGLPADIVEVACANLQRQPRRDYETAFPALGDVLEACREVERTRQAVAHRRWLEEHPLPNFDPGPPMSKAEVKAFIAQMKADVDAIRRVSRRGR